MSLRLVLPCVALLVISGACSAITDSSREAVVLDQTYMFGPCSREWSPDTPPAERTVVDVSFRGEEGSPPATSAQVAIVRAVGGTNLYAFNLPMVRADLDVDAVRELVRPGSSPLTAVWAKTVVDPGRRDVSVFVGLTRELTDGDIAAAEALGARVTHRFDFINAYVIEVDDSRLPVVRRLPDVRYVERNSFVCGAEVENP
jgi:hypothetical protein